MIQIARNVIETYFDDGLNYYRVRKDGTLDIPCDHYRTQINGVHFVATQEPVTVAGLEPVEVVETE